MSFENQTVIRMSYQVDSCLCVQYARNYEKDLVGDPVMLLRCLWNFLFPVLKKCTPLWMSAAAFPFRLFNCVVSKALSDGLVVCDLEHRWCISAL